MLYLRENLTFKDANVVYEATENSHGGKDLYMKGICIQGGVENANKRVYPVAEITNAVTTINEHQIKQYKNIQATDVIPYNDVLMMIGTDGFYQYDYSNLNDIKLLSKIEVQHN